MKLEAFLLLLFSATFANGLAPSNFAMTPESMVQAQLDAMKVGDFKRAYACYSDDSKIVIGSVDNFKETACKSPFETLIEHEDAQVIMTSTFMDPDVASCLVKIVFAEKWRKKKHKDTPCLYFTWELSREDEDSPWEVEAFFPDFDDMDFEEVELIAVDEDWEEGDMFGLDF